MFDFRQATVFVWYTASKHKMTTYAKNYEITRYVKKIK